jgi:hypothetical protein
MAPTTSSEALHAARVGVMSARYRAFDLDWNSVSTLDLHPHGVTVRRCILSKVGYPAPWIIKGFQSVKASVQAAKCQK